MDSETESLFGDFDLEEENDDVVVALPDFTVEAEDAPETSQEDEQLLNLPPLGKTEQLLDALAALSGDRTESSLMFILSNIACGKTVEGRREAKIQGNLIQLPGKVNLTQFQTNLQRIRNIANSAADDNELKLLADGCARFYLENSPQRTFEFQYYDPKTGRNSIVYLSGYNGDDELYFSTDSVKYDPEAYERLLRAEHKDITSKLPLLLKGEQTWERQYIVYIDDTAVNPRDVGICLDIYSCRKVPCECNKANLASKTNIAYNAVQQRHERAQLIDEYQCRNGKTPKFVKTRAIRKVISTRRMNKVKLFHGSSTIYAPLVTSAHSAHRAFYSRTGKRRLVDQCTEDMRTIIQRYEGNTLEELRDLSKEIAKDEKKDSNEKASHLIAIARCAGRKIDYCTICNVTYREQDRAGHVTGKHHLQRVELLRKKSARITTSYDTKDQQTGTTADDQNDAQLEAAGSNKGNSDESEQSFSDYDKLAMFADDCETGHISKCACGFYGLTKLECCGGRSADELAFCHICEENATISQRFPHNGVNCPNGHQAKEGRNYCQKCRNEGIDTIDNMIAIVHDILSDDEPAPVAPLVDPELG